MTLKKLSDYFYTFRRTGFIARFAFLKHYHVFLFTVSFDFPGLCRGGWQKPSGTN